MEVKILLLLIVFMALLIGGIILTARGALMRNRRQMWLGIILLALTILFTMATKYVAGLY